MLPTFNDAGDIVLLERLSCRFNKLERGDVIVAKSPTNPSHTVCKRIRAMVSFLLVVEVGNAGANAFYLKQQSGDTVKVTSYYGSSTTHKVCCGTNTKHAAGPSA